MKLFVSVTDFPLLRSQKGMLSSLLSEDLDGIEWVVGVKSRFHLESLVSYCTRYGVSSFGIHQPPWSGLGVYFDEGLIRWAKKHHASYVTFHPLMGMSFANMKGYLTRLSFMKKKYGIEILLENMDDVTGYHLLYETEKGKKTKEEHIEDIGHIAKTYALGVTYDTSHTKWARPFDHAAFRMLFPYIHNIHLSSFDEHREHLPLGMGELDYVSFLSLLKEKKYQGIVNLEIHYPKLLSLYQWDQEKVTTSIRLLSQILGK